MTAKTCDNIDNTGHSVVEPIPKSNPSASGRDYGCLSSKATCNLLFIGFGFLSYCLVFGLLTLFVFRKLPLQKFGVNVQDISIRAVIKELSTYFAEDKLIIHLVYWLPIFQVMREWSTRKHFLFGLASEPIKCLHRHPLGSVIDRLNTSASFVGSLRV